MTINRLCPPSPTGYHSWQDNDLCLHCRKPIRSYPMPQTRYSVALPSEVGKPELYECKAISPIHAARYVVNLANAATVVTNGYFTPVTMTTSFKESPRVAESQLGKLLLYDAECIQIPLDWIGAQAEFDRVHKRGERFRVNVCPTRRPSVDDRWWDADHIPIPPFCYADVLPDYSEPGLWACGKADCITCQTMGYVKQEEDEAALQPASA